MYIVGDAAVMVLKQFDGIVQSRYEKDKRCECDDAVEANLYPNMGKCSAT